MATDTLYTGYIAYNFVFSAADKAQEMTSGGILKVSTLEMLLYFVLICLQILTVCLLAHGVLAFSMLFEKRTTKPTPGVVSKIYFNFERFPTLSGELVQLRLFSRPSFSI